MIRDILIAAGIFAFSVVGVVALSEARGAPNGCALYHATELTCTAR